MPAEQPPNVSPDSPPPENRPADGRSLADALMDQAAMDQSSIDELLRQASFEDPAMLEAAALAAAASGPAPAPSPAFSAAAAAAGTGPAGAAGLTADAAPLLSDAADFKLPNFQQVMQDAQASSIDLLRDVELNVKIELGRSRMLVEDVLKLAEGSVVELDKLAGDPVDVFVNDRLVARGEVLVLNDNFCVRVNEIVAGAKDEGL